MIKIKVLAKEVTMKDGKKFWAYKAVKPNGKLIDIRFTKNAGTIPTKSFILEAKDENLNIDKNREYPILWCREISNIENIKVKEEFNAKKEFDNNDKDEI